MLSRETRTRLVVLNVALWAVCAVIALAVLGGPRGVVREYLEPIDRELGGVAKLAVAASGLGNPTFPVYELAIAPEVLRTARLMRVASPTSEASPYDDTPWARAQFRTDGAVFDVEVQLLASVAGSESLRDQAWRVRFARKHSYRGMRELTLQAGHTLAHVRESVVREMALRSGLIAPPSGLASLVVNGRDAGVVFWSEGSSAEMLERLGYAEGEIFTPLLASLGMDAVSPIALAGYSSAIDRDGAQGPAAGTLRRLLLLTRDASDSEFEHQIGQLLDVDKYLRWNALVWVFGRSGADGFRNPWYFDPVSGLLEPVVTDLGRGTGTPVSVDAIAAVDEPQLIARLLRSDEYRAQRNRALWDLVSADGLDVETASEERLGSLLTALARSDGSLARMGELKRYAEFRRAERISNRERVATIRSALEATEIETRTQPSLEAGVPTLTLELSPHGLAEILLTELRLEFGSALQAVKASAGMRLFDVQGAQRRATLVMADVVGSSITLRPEHFEVRTVVASGNEPVAPWRVKIELPFVPRDQWSQPGYLRQVEVAYLNAITGDSLPTARIRPSQFAMTAADGELMSALRPIDAVIAESGLPFELVGDELVLPSGNHVLTHTLIVPADYRLRLERGVNLRLGADVSVVSFRGMTALGTRQQPVRIRRADPDRAWGTLAVARSPEASELVFLSVSGGSRADYAGIEFSAQLSFNASDFTLTDSEIQGSYKSDGLSAKRSSYLVTRTQFLSNHSDGFDSKWSQGAIQDSWFSGNGDDGLDLINSEVSVRGCAFAGMGDKAISAGLRSRVAVSDTRLVDSEVAIASKDDSRVDVRETEFRRNRLGFSLYRGKQFFGGGMGTVRGGLFAQNDRDFSVEPGSDLQLVDVNRESVGASSTESALLRAFNRVRPVAFRPIDQSPASRIQFNMLYSSIPVNGKNLY